MSGLQLGYIKCLIYNVLIQALWAVIRMLLGNGWV